MNLRLRFSRAASCSVAVALVGLANTAPAKVMDIIWDTLPALPPAAGQSKQAGLASPFVGIDHDALIVAGGANFPDQPPWEGGAKKWWGDIFVLEKLSRAQPQWVRQPGLPLPRPLAYGVSVSTREGILCAGGSDAERCYADVFLLSWDPVAGAIRRTSLPPMPEPLALMGGALVGDTFYVAGGQHTMKGAVPSSAFWSLDLAQRHQPGFGWKVLPAWPGPARVVPVTAGQGGATGGRFYLFSGREPRAGTKTNLLSDAYAFDPATQSWKALGPIGGGRGTCAMAGVAVAADDDEVLVFGGDRGDLFLELEAHDLAIESLRRQLADAPTAARAAREAEIEEHLRAKKKIYHTHPGFGREVYSYSAKADAWRVVARSPVPLPVTTFAARQGDTIFLPSGEIRPGIRTPEVVRARLVRKP